MSVYTACDASTVPQTWDSGFACALKMTLHECNATERTS